MSNAEVSDANIISTEVLYQLLHPLQDEDDPDEPPSISVEELCDEIPDYSDKDIKAVIDDLAVQRTGVNYEDGELLLENRELANNYFSMCSPYG